MDVKRLIRLGIGFLALTLVPVVGIAIGQQTPPTENKGVKIVPAAAIDLGPEISGMQGRQLRMRVVTLEPGGVFGVHDHKDRPAIDYVLQGAVTDHRGSDAKEYHAGMTITEAQGLTHWVENKGTIPAMIVAVDVFHQL
jgi:quercetin dioxygenase-like cupin family protein